MSWWASLGRVLEVTFSVGAMLRHRAPSSLCRLKEVRVAGARGQ